MSPKVPPALAITFLLLLAPLAATQAPANPRGPATGATTAELADFLAALEAHPGVQAAAAGVEAARLQLSSARDPLQFEFTGGWSRVSMGELQLPPGVEAPPSGGGAVSANVTFRPFPFGDIRDLVDQREIALAQAQLDYLDTLAGLQAQAVEAALGVQLARQGVTIATQGAELAREAFESTRLRFERGAATARELREAESGLLEADNVLQDAIANAETALAALGMLVGDVAAPDLFGVDLPVPVGTPVQVLRSQLQLRLAELAPRGAQRNLLPTAQASYSRNLGDNANMSISLESRTLQPSVGYEYQSPARSFPESEIEGTFQIGVSLSISRGALQELEAARSQVAAARGGLDAATRAADLQFRTLRSGAEGAARSLALAERKVTDAEARLAETRSRVESGLAVPLELQNESLAVTQARLELLSARQALQQSILDLYTFYALPLTDVLEEIR